jgi:type II secretory pathway predicted ATPase ExeA
VFSRPQDEKSSCDWQSYWGFDRTPFVQHDPPYVSLPSHDETARVLADCVQTGQRGALLTAEAGLGKTTVLRRVLAEARNPRRRCVLVSCPREGGLLPGLLAERLGERVGREPGRLACWRAIERALRLTSIVGYHVVIGIDDCQNASPAVRRDIEAVASLESGMSMRLTIIQAGRPIASARARARLAPGVALGLDSLTRSEAERYLTTKLAGAGCNEPVFTPRAVTRLHCSSAGVPAAIDQLAARCLMLGAVRRIEAIPHELVDAVDAETNRFVWSGGADTQAG